MERFLAYVLSHLVEFPGEMVLTKEETGKRVVFYLRVRQSDIGKVVGKHGSTIAAIRNLLGAAAAKQGARATLEIVEESGRGGADRPGERTARTEDTPSA